MQATYHYDKNHKMIYVGQKVRAGGKIWVVTVQDGAGKSPFQLESAGEIRRLNDFGALQIEICTKG